MEITKTFSSSDGEKLYSVSLSGDELALFSEEKKKKRIGSGLIAGGLAANMAAGKYVMNRFKDDGGEEGKKIVDKMVKNSGTRVVDASIGDLGPAYNFKDKTVYKAGSNNPGVIAHELGHAHYDKQTTKTGIGKLSHKGYKRTGGGLSYSVFSPMTGVVAGRVSGKRAAKAEAEGKKESKLNRHAAWAAPLAVQGAGLVAEAAASRKGLKMMKSAGASKKMISQAKKDLGAAWVTYGSRGVMNAGIGELSRAKAYNREKKKQKTDK